WAAAIAECILRQCPRVFERFGCRAWPTKQAHDENHDWIDIRRGLCNRCQKTITFLPPFSLPYTHYRGPCRHIGVRACHRSVRRATRAPPQISKQAVTYRVNGKTPTF